MVFLKSPKKVTPAKWPAGNSPRVLFENPDLAVAGAQAASLRTLGYDVAFCRGPENASSYVRPLYWSDAETPLSRRLVCPLTRGGECTLADGADVIITTTNLVDANAVHDALQAGQATVLVVEPGKMVDPAALDVALSRSRRARPPEPALSEG